MILPEGKHCQWFIKKVCLGEFPDIFQRATERQTDRETERQTDRQTDVYIYANLTLETCEVLLVTLKAFYKVRYAGLIYNLKLVEVLVDLLKLMKNLLDNRFQTVLLNC